LAHVLFTAVNYWPEPSGNAPYTTALAECLVAAGHQVTVVTGFPHYPSWRVGSGYEGHVRQTEIVAGVRVLRRRHFVPSSQSVVTRALYEATFLLHGLASRPVEADVVVGVVPSLGGAALARLFAARWHAPYGVIVQDLVGPAAAQSGMPSGGRVAGVIARLESWSLARARRVAIVSPSFAPYLRSIGVASERIVQLPNWTLHQPPAIDKDAARDQFGWAHAHVVLHAGNMGLKQGLEQLLDAAELARTAAPGLRFVLLGDGNQRALLQRAAAHLANVEFLPSQADDAYASALAAADVLILSERPTVADMSLPSKLTAYCAAGRPIVAAVREGGATFDEVRRSGAGVTVPAGDAKALLEAITRLAGDAELARQFGAAGANYARTTLGAASGLERGRMFVEGLLAASKQTSEAAA
jgi:colanic acid biosynthesis glycosyl transferase WcaI